MRRLKGHKWQNKANLLLALNLLCKTCPWRGKKDMQDQSKKTDFLQVDLHEKERKDDYLI